MSTTNIIPGPPVFKASFIQMQRPQNQASTGSNHNDDFKTNYLTSSYIPDEEHRNNLINHSPSISPMTHCKTDPPLANTTSFSSPKIGLKKRRRSNTKEESERKRRDIKAQHSVIEKKRRIKMNREFEALKFLVPACRTSILTGLATSNSFENSNLMHKLTVLQSTVEYIKYLHLIIRLMKLQMLLPKNTRQNYKSWFQKNSNLNFVDFDLYLERYRDIEKDFDFEDLFLQVWKNKGSLPDGWMDPITKQIYKIINEDNDDVDTLKQALKDDKSSTVESASPSKGPSFENKKSNFQPPMNQIPLTPMTLLNTNNDKRHYNKSVSEIGKETNFKLPLPAIIAPHPNALNDGLQSNPAPILNASYRNNSCTLPSISTPVSAPVPSPVSGPIFVSTRTSPVGALAPRFSAVSSKAGYTEVKDSILPRPISKSTGALNASLPKPIDSLRYPPSFTHPASISMTSNSSSESVSSLQNYYVVKDPHLDCAMPVKGKQIPTTLKRDEDVHEASQVLISLRTNSL